MVKLRVGVTGGYPPFSTYSNQLQRFVGFDIELIEVFAKYHILPYNVARLNL